MNRENLNKILKSTNGEIKYFEQVLFILKECGFSATETTKIVKSYGKKNVDSTKDWEYKMQLSMKKDLALDLINNIKRNIETMTFKYQGFPITSIFNNTCSVCKKKVSSIKFDKDNNVYCIPCSKEQDTEFIAIMDIGSITYDYTL